MTWSLESYNLIVYANIDDPIFQNVSGRSSFPKARIFEDTDDDLKDKYQENIASLSELPTIVLGEINYSERTPALFGQIYELTIRGPDVSFQFQRLAALPSSEDVFNCRYFDISISRTGIDERNRTHWAIKKGNLIEGVLKLIKDQSDNQRPRLFNVKQWPLPTLGHIAVMMPFNKEFDPVHRAIQEACASQRYQTIRVDEIYGPTKIMGDIFSTIAQCKFVIGDLTGRNPNVLYEIGLAHALDRDVIMVVQNPEDIPFDLRHLRYFPYLQNEQGMEQLKKDLSESIRASADISGGPTL